MTQSAHTGRRKGGVDTRALIETVARSQFSELGYDRTSMRQIAREAAVDPTLVTHFYGTKIQLFLRVVRLPVDPEQIVGALVSGPREEAGRRLAQFVIDTLEDAATRHRIIGMIRAALAEPKATALLRQVLADNVLVPMARQLGTDQPEYRASLVMSQIVGIILARYVVALDHLASRTPAEMAAALAPTFQRYLTGAITP